MEIKPSRIVWHHSADGQQRTQFDIINAYHHKIGFPISSLGFWVGYHYLIEFDGTIRKAREENEIGAHDTGENLNSIGICLAGNFDKFLPNPAQAVAASRLIADIRTRWKIPVTRIEPHRWDDTTACPGILLSDNWLINEFLKRDTTSLLWLFYWIGQKYELL